MSHGAGGTGSSPAARSARRLVITPRVVLIPSAAQAKAAFMAASHAELGAYLGALGLNVAAGRRLAARPSTSLRRRHRRRRGAAAREAPRDLRGQHGG